MVTLHVSRLKKLYSPFGILVVLVYLYGCLVALWLYVASSHEPGSLQEPVPTIYDGMWVVGVSIPAGTYQLDKAIIKGNCYWAITREGGSTVIENDIVTGGRPTVTLPSGTEFTSNYCGTWMKVG